MYRHWLPGVVAVALCGLAWITQAGPANAPAHADDQSAGPTTDVFEGEVVYLGEELRKQGTVELWDEALDDVAALKTKEGRLIPILPNEAGLFFYRDERARHQPMRIHGRLMPTTGMLDVVDRYHLVKGVPMEIYYWCEICSIRMYHLKDCDCCQGPIELREHPVGESYRLKNQ